MGIAHRIYVPSTIQRWGRLERLAKHYRASYEVIHMSDNIPLEQIVQELQMVSQQLVSVQTQIRELEGTIEHLSKQIEGNSIFQQVGPLLVEVDDIDTLNSSLIDTSKQLSEHAEKLSSREGELRTAYEEAVKQFESS